jgi:hypothetical protein
MLNPIISPSFSNVGPPRTRRGLLAVTVKFEPPSKALGIPMLPFLMYWMAWIERASVKFRVRVEFWL